MKTKKDNLHKIKRKKLNAVDGTEKFKTKKNLIKSFDKLDILLSDAVCETTNEEKTEETDEKIVADEKPRTTKKRKEKKIHLPKNIPLNENGKRQLEQLKKQCKLDGLGSKKISLIVKKWKRREKRRLQRVEERKKEKICFHCRQMGHTVDQCPQQTNEDECSSLGVCFKCGSTEHTVVGCKLKTTGFPYAKCFICKKTGHLSRDCEENPNGAYPEGGNCKRCGKCDHLIKDCPESRKEKGNLFESNSTGCESDTAMDDNEEMEKKKISFVKKKSTKIVKF